MIRPARLRAIRAFRNETQEEFANHFGTSRYRVMFWEKYGIVDQPDLERLILNLEGPSDDNPRVSPRISTREVSRK